MPFVIKNWKLALTALILFCFFNSLGYWQLRRAHTKEILIQHFNQQLAAPALNNKDLKATQDVRFRRIELTGHFINEYTFLLDNKIFQRQVGYEIYTLFVADGIPNPILVDRGFIALTGDRQHLPHITPITGKQLLSAMLNQPPTYVALGAMQEAGQKNYPMRIEFIDLRQLSKVLELPLYPYIAILPPGQSHSYPIEWQAVTMPPERHRGYAVQWFALASALLLLFLTLNRKSQN